MLVHRTLAPSFVAVGCLVFSSCHYLGDHFLAGSRADESLDAEDQPLAFSKRVVGQEDGIFTVEFEVVNKSSEPVGELQISEALPEGVEYLRETPLNSESGESRGRPADWTSQVKGLAAGGPLEDGLPCPQSLSRAGCCHRWCQPHAN